jgi:hypothetical protein
MVSCAIGWIKYYTGLVNSGDTIEKRWAGHVASMLKRRGIYRVGET